MALTPLRLHVLDLSDTWSDARTIDERYDLALVAVCLQGLVNRDAARLLLYGLPYGNWARFSQPVDFDGNIDRYVLRYSTLPGAWLENAVLEPVDSLTDLIRYYRDRIRGLVVWDGRLDATANVATTVAAVEDLLPVRFDEGAYPSGRPSLYRVLTEELRLPVERSLVGCFPGAGTIPETGRPSTGSAKCDAYLWAKERYLDTGKCRADLIGYVEDAYARRHPRHYNQWLAMRDYLVSERGFVLDLSAWDDERPVDDPEQPLGADRRTLNEILKSAYARTRGETPIRFFGFTPWAEKYTNYAGAGGQHGPVETEWHLTKVVTPYNGHMVVDIYQGFTANLSLYRLAPPIDRLTQETLARSAHPALPAARPASEPPTLNVLFYMGDYCDIGAVYNILPINWDDPARGKIPLGWSFTPVMATLLPDLIRWMYETRSENDHFMLGPGLYGYNMPNHLPGGTPYEANKRLAAAWCRKLDLDVTGFFIGYEPPSEAALALYQEATPAGVLTNHWRARDARAAVPHLGMYDLCTPGADPEAVVGELTKHVEAVYPPGARQGVAEGFVAFRCIWVEPALIVEVLDRARQRLPDWRIRAVDPHAFFAAFRASDGQGPARQRGSGGAA